jgi:L-arabinose isomerase
VNCLDGYEVWFVTGSQHLYGEEVLNQVEEDSRAVVRGLEAAGTIPLRVVAKRVLTSADAIHALALEANQSSKCIGVIAWMHTFSPAKMWIAGVKALQKPLLHLHTQYGRDLPWATIDMDFMNLHQAAHGDREFGYLLTRLGVRRKVVVGHWSEPEVAERIANWSRSAAGWAEAHRLRVARFGDNMRDVAVTEGDKVEAQVRLGVSVNGFGIGDLSRRVADVSDDDISRVVGEYLDLYNVSAALQPGGARHRSLREAAAIEVGLRSFLEEGSFGAFTDTFEDLGGLAQLPGIAVQRLMAEGYGFGAEGDWKTAALVRLTKVMASGLVGGTSFMEDYTYDLSQPRSKVLGAHMLEVCPSIARDQPTCEIHPLAIGGKPDPVRLVFTAPAGRAVVVGLVDMGSRFRLVANEVDVVEPDEVMPRLPVARAVWEPRPNLRTAAEAWLLAGGPHHTSFSMALPIECFSDFAEIAGIELLVINDRTTIVDLKNELRWNTMYHGTVSQV